MIYYELFCFLNPKIWCIWCVLQFATISLKYLTMQFPDVPGTQLINLRMMKGWVDLGATQLSLGPLDWESSALTTKPLLQMVSITGVFLVTYEISECTSEELCRTPKLTIPMTLRCHSLCEPDCTFSLRPMRRLVTHRLVTLTHLFQESHKLSSHKNHLCPRAWWTVVFVILDHFFPFFPKFKKNEKKKTNKKNI